MPTRVFRRTPTSERAAIYDYKDLLKDSISLLRRRATENVERMTSGGMSDEELLEIGLAPAGGMLKVAGTSKLLAGLLKAKVRERKVYERTSLTPKAIASRMELRFRPARSVFKEALKVPEKEYGRIKDISWSSMKGEALDTKGLYFPMERDITLNPHLADLETIWHEFTHARQYNPEVGSRLPKGKNETVASYELRTLLNTLTEVAESTGMSKRQFYRTISPIERHARGVAHAAVKFPKDFSTLYKYGLQSEIVTARKKLAEFWGD